MPIHFGKYPYAFLVVLCDVIQDWQRSLGGTDFSELQMIDASFSGDTPVVEVDLLINASKKIEELDKLYMKLKPDGSMRIHIRQTNGRATWTLS